jgi:hypothetical protein
VRSTFPCSGGEVQQRLHAWLVPLRHHRERQAAPRTSSRAQAAALPPAAAGVITSETSEARSKKKVLFIKHLFEAQNNCFMNKAFTQFGSPDSASSVTDSMAASSSGGPYFDGTHQPHCDIWRIFQVEEGQPIPPRSELHDYRGKPVIWGEPENWNADAICRHRNGVPGTKKRCDAWNKGLGCRFWLVCDKGDHPPGMEWRKKRYATADDGTMIEVPCHVTDMTFENICWQAHTEGTCGLLGPESEQKCHRFHACTPWSPNAIRVHTDLYDLRPEEVTSITMRPKVDKKMPADTFLLPCSWMPKFDLSMRHCETQEDLMRWRPIQDESIPPAAYDNGPLAGNFPVDTDHDRARSAARRVRRARSKSRRLSRSRGQPRGQPVGQPDAATSETGVPQPQAAAPRRKAPPPPPPNDMAPAPQAGRGRARNKVRFSAESGDVMPGARRSKTPGPP